MATTSLPHLHSRLLLLLLLAAASSSPSPAPPPLLALLSLKSSLSDPLGALRAWTPAAPWCAWPGVACDAATGAVVGLDLSRRNLSGAVPPAAARSLAPTLRYLNLSGNAFSGELPPAVLSLRRLVSLDVSHNCFNSAFPDAGIARLRSLAALDAYSNCFVGPLPRGIAALRRLESVNLGGSFFNGSIPAELGGLRVLRYLHLAGNALTGRLPEELGGLTRLEHLEIGYNWYVGGVPAAFGRLARLRYLDIASANLSGPLPPELGGLRRLESLYLFKNRLAGPIPASYSQLGAMRVLDLSDNRLAGPIPAGLGELSNLTMLSLMSNSLSGRIPAAVGALPSLEVLQLWNNSLTGELPRTLGSSGRLVRLDVSTNALSGPIPPGLCAGHRLARLILFANRFDSAIPASLAKCPSLWRIRLESNRLSGAIPAGFGSLPNLTYMDLSGNSLAGGIPADLLASPSLEFLNLSGNPVGGALPEATWCAPKLQVFAASECSLGGSVPAFGASGCANLYTLELAGNLLSGAIPSDIGECKKLVSLKLGHNRLTGEIPAALAALPSITDIDLSSNMLTGTIPPGFANCTTLESFEVSGNRLGPTETPASADGRPEARATAMWAAAMGVAFAGMVVLAVGARWLHWQDGDSREGGGGATSAGGPWRMMAFQRLNFTADDVERCVAGSDGIVGVGSSGTVHRAKMPGGEVIAVKKLRHPPARKGGRGRPDRRLLAEVEVLGQLRHRNIVRLLGWCTDGEAAMLLYEYMPNGSLEELLHGGGNGGGGKKGRWLDWEARYRIAVGVAQGVSYLHHDCRPAVAHRDLKPSNILLDADMEARVADFGVAKLLHGAGPMSAVAGSCGYIAPEYAYTLQVDERSDIYSYGVVVMELLSGRRPVDAEYGEGRGIVEWVRRSIAQGGEAGARAVLDTMAAGAECEEVRQEMLLVLRVALLCTSSNPEDRPSMRDVLSMLQEAKPNRKHTISNKQAPQC